MAGPSDSLEQQTPRAGSKVGSWRIVGLVGHGFKWRNLWEESRLAIFWARGKLAKKSRERFGKIGKKLIHQDQILDKLSKLGKSQS